MRIGIDVFPLTSPSTGARGIGRYSLSFMRSLVENNQQHEFVLYRRGPERPQEMNLFSPGESIFNIDRFVYQNDNCTLKNYFENEKEKITSLNILAPNPDNLDWLIITSPHESYVNRKIKGCKLASIVYDTIPDRFPKIYLDNPAMTKYAKEYAAYHKALDGYDCLLAISESTANDMVTYRDHDRDHIVNISGSCDPMFVPRPVNWVYPKWITELTHEQPYILHIGGMDGRKGGQELLQAFKLLDPRLRTRFKLIYAYEVDSTYQFYIQKQANLMGLAMQFYLLGYVTDKKLVELYQNAYMMVLPSKAEGFGLPILESIACGVPVIAGNNTSQPEIVCDSGLLVDEKDPENIKRAMLSMIDDASVYGRFKRRTQIDRLKFSWKDTANRTMSAIESSPVAVKGRVTDVATRSTSKPRLAFFGLVPPTMSGITPYSMNLASALTEHYDITFYHDPSIAPQEYVGPLKNPLKGSEKITFKPANKYEGTPRILHMMGNSHYHAWQIEYMKKDCIITLHDVDLTGFHSWLLRTRNATTESSYEKFHNNLFRKVKSIIVHSSYARNIISPEYRASVIPFGANVNEISLERKDQIREKFKLPRTGITANEMVLIGTGGLVHPTKNCDILLSAYLIAKQALDIGSKDGRHLCLAIIGKEVDGGLLRKLAELWRVPDIYWTGELSHNDFADAIGALDIAIQLRQGPTNGETSAALIDALRAGVPVITSNAGSFSEFINGVYVVDNDVTKIANKIIDWCSYGNDRRVVGEYGRNGIIANHSWKTVASMYRDVIENSFERMVKAHDKVLLS